MSRRSTRQLDYLQSRLPDDLTSGITGNVALEIKELPVKWLAIFRNGGRGFAGSIATRLRVTDVSVVPSVDDPLKMEGKVVCEIEVTSDMCNEKGVLGEGCIFFLVDECSTVAMVVGNAYGGLNRPPGVSQTINTFYHSPAPVGTKLRLVSTSLSSGLETNAGRCEIWDTVNHRLVASGTQQTMPPSTPVPFLVNFEKISPTP